MEQEGTATGKLKKLKAVFGNDFPGFESKKGDDWKNWLEAVWKKQLKVMRDKRLHWSRHRHFKQGRQWISTRDGRTWHEPRHDKNTIRSTLNLIGPSLDYRLGILREQRPGFRYEAIGSTVEAKEQAQAQQQVVEYYFHLLKAWTVLQDALQAAQTDGCAFLHIFKDAKAGPSKKRTRTVAGTDPRARALLAMGHKPVENGNIVVPLSEAGDDLGPGEDAFEFNTGDLGHRVVYAYETVADPEAKTVNGPYDKAKWMVIRRIISEEEARLKANDPDITADVKGRDTDPLDEAPDTVAQTWSRGLPPYPTHRRRDTQGVFEYIVYFNSGVADEIPDGAWVHIISNKYVDGDTELPGGVIPLAQIRDGSSDPELYPRPTMSDWIGDQITINALVSLLVMHARVFGGGRVIAQKDTIIEESFSAIVGSLIEFSGMKPEFVAPPRTAANVWDLLQFFIRKFEDKSSWNDLARGQVTGSGSMQDVSGRAVLGARELFERSFGPMIRAAADGVSAWADLVVYYARDLFTEPRLVPVMGGRPDLAKYISGGDLGGIPVVYADPETMMPLPRAHRNQMLFELYQNQVIDLAEYKSRAPYAFIRDVFSGEQQQWSRAQLVNEVLIENFTELAASVADDPLAPYRVESGIPVLWTDDSATHQKALLEIILDDRKDWAMRQLAIARYNVYEDMAATKMGGGVGPDGMPMPPPPLPVEVIGAPADLPRKPQAPPAEGSMEATMNVSGAPEMAGTQTPTTASQQQAQPLGTYGKVEEQMAGGEALPQ